MSDGSFSKEISYVFWWWVVRILLLNILMAGGGAFLVGLEIYSAIYHQRPPQIIEDASTYVGSVTTLLGVFITAASVYLPNLKPTRPSPEARYLVAWLVMLICIVAICYLFVHGSVPPNAIVGFAMVGLAGALFRMLPNPQRAAEPTM